MLNTPAETFEDVGNTHRNFPTKLNFEIFVQHGFSELEVAAITHTLQVVNQVIEEDLCHWRFVSDTPGFVSGAGGQIIRAVPAVPDHNFCDHMIVVGGLVANPQKWLPRLRSMTRDGLIVVLLSSAATAYIKAVKPMNTTVTTHWSDFAVLRESCCRSDISNRLSERTGNIITAAGAGATSELVIELLADVLSASEMGEVGNRLVLPAIRNSRADQPNSIADIYPCFDKNLSQAIKIMEQEIEQPILVGDLARSIGISTRQLERIFNATLGTTPAKFYKNLRLKQARVLVEETPISVLEIALATGFSSSNSLSRAFRDEYGVTPFQIRTRKSIPVTVGG